MLECIVDLHAFLVSSMIFVFYTLEILYLCFLVDIEAIPLYTVTVWTAAY